MRKLFISLLTAALTLTAAAAGAEIPGLSSLLTRQGLHFVVIGDLHGTEELPAFFGQLVEEAAAHREAVVVTFHEVSKESYASGGVLMADKGK